MSVTTNIFEDISTLQILLNIANLTPDGLDDIVSSGTLNNENNFIECKEWESGTPVITELMVNNDLELVYSPDWRFDAEVPVIGYGTLTYEERQSPFVPPVKATEFVYNASDINAKRVGAFFDGKDDIQLIEYDETEPHMRFRKGLRGYVGDLKVKMIDGGNNITNITSLTTGLVSDEVSYMKYQYGYNETEHDYTYSWSSTSGYNTFNRLLHGILWNTHFVSSSIQLKTNYYIFETETDLDYYLRTGDGSKALTTKPVAKDRTTELYLYAQEFNSEFSIKVPSNVLDFKQIKFSVRSTTESGDKIDNISRAVIGYIVSGNDMDEYKNLKFLKNSNFEVTKIETRTNGGEWQDVTGTFDWSSVYTVYSDTVYYDGYYWWSNISTNMYIFDNMANAIKGLLGLTDGLLKNVIGKGVLSKTALTDNMIDYDIGMSETYLLTQEKVNQLANRFNQIVTSDGNILGGMFVGLAMHNNPIDVCIDLFALPIDVTDFVTTSTHSINLGVTTSPTSNV